MANTVIVSPSLVTTGDDSGNFFVFNSGALSGSTIIGGAGKDTVEILSGESAVSDVLIDLKGGQDSIAITAMAFGSSTIKAGAGADTIDIRSAGPTVLNSVYGGDGDDLLILSGLADVENVFMGGGSDFISGSVALSASGAEILLGAGADTVSITASEFASSTVWAAAGDSIAADINAAATAVKIHDAAGVVGKRPFVTGCIQVSDNANIQGAGGADLTSDLLKELASSVTMVATPWTECWRIPRRYMPIGGGAGSDDHPGYELAVLALAHVIGGGGADSISISKTARCSA